MKTYTASRLSQGNKIYPCKISIDDQSITLTLPGFFKGKESTIPLNRISSVDIETPLVGFSTIHVETTGEGSIIAHGFTKAEVIEIKETLLAKVNGA
jgi:uncharacterized membrane protein YdbT with pleckstrin-like domain